MGREKLEVSKLSAQDKRRLLARLLAEKANRSPRAFPLSYGQQALWYLHQLAPESPAYNFTYAWWIRSDLDVAALRRSFQRFVDRHPVLRTTYEIEDGRPIQRVHPQQDVHFVEIDASGWACERLEQQLRIEAHRPFDLQTGPVIRVTLYRCLSGEHLLEITFHHIAVDFWCAPLLLDELRVSYQAAREGKDAPLAPLRVDYADFVRWQKQMLDGPEGQRHLTYWRKQLGGEISVLNLPTDRPRPGFQSYQGGLHTFKIEGPLTQRLKQLARTEATTLFAVLLAAFHVLLLRHTGQEDIVVGCPTSGRVRPGFEKIIGYFANPVALRADLSANPTFVEFLRRVRDTVLGALEHQAYPFARLVEELHPQRDPSRSPFFDVMFTLQSMQRFARDGQLSRPAGPGPDVASASSFGAASLGDASARFELGDLVLESFPIDMTVAQFDLDLEMIELHGALAGQLHYNAELFDPPTVESMGSRFELLLDRIVTDPNARIGDIPLLTEPERHQLLVEWNDTREPFPEDSCIHELFERQVERTPDAVAVISGDRHLTYRELNARANRVAHRLRDAGVGPEVLVSICLNRSWQMLVGILGILKAGGAYLPLDPEYPAERLAFMLEDAQVPVVLTDPRLATSLPAEGRRCLFISEILESGTPQDETNVGRTSEARNLAYVIYTSGSTGIPKGILIEHRSVVNHNLAIVKLYGLRPEDRVLQFSSFNFDAPVEELFPTWLSGGSVVMRDQPALPSHAEMRELFEKYHLTVLNYSAAYWSEWVQEMSWAGERLPACLRSVSVGGEKPPRERFDAWLRLGGDRVQWVNTYGPTEATVIVTSFEPSREWIEASPKRDIPIGRPLPNTQLYVLDSRLQPVPVGVPGELFIGGVPLARGYLNRPELTAERFIPNPFDSTPGERLYRTGDRVRYLRDGQIEFLGRIDEQVKVRGFRIEPGEVETALLHHPAVRGAAVVAREGETGGQRLIAYIESSPRASPSPSDLRMFLKDRLPAYMVPAAFVMIDKIPRMSNRKVNRRALPAPESARPEISTAFVESRSPVEQTLAEIWQALLGLERVGVHDNFFELGGDSILSVQVVARANQAGLRLTARHVFQYQTIAELAAVVGTGRVIQAEQGPVVGEVLLTPIQRWFFDQDFPEAHHFNQAFLLEVPEGLDAGTLREAVHQLLIHHDALRMRFERTDAGWRQRQTSPEEVQTEAIFACRDLTSLPRDRHSEALEQDAAQWQASLDLADGPLIRVVLYRRGGPDRLLIVAHHLVVDGVSWRILLEDLWTTYAQLIAGRAAQLPPKTTSLREWAARLAEYARSGTLAEDITYWRETISAPFGRLPVDHPEGVNDVASLQMVHLSLSSEETCVLLHEVPAVYRMRINEVLVVALAQALAGWTGSRSVLFNLEGHGREDLFEDVDLSRTVGWLATIFPVRVELPETVEPAAAIQAVKEQLRGVPRHGISHGLLRDWGGDAQWASQLRAVAPEVSLNYLGQFSWTPSAASAGLPGVQPVSLVDEPCGSLVSPKARRPHLLDINCGVSRGRLEVACTFSRNVHDRVTIERLAADFETALRAIITLCEKPDAGGCTPSDFPLARIDAAALTRLVGTGRHVEDIYPLSPLQAGLLYHHLYAPDSGLYFAQVSCSVQGDLDVEAFRRSWQKVLDRHPALRTSFAWKGLAEPHQIVHRHVAITLMVEDWRPLAAAEQQARLESFLEADRRRGFDLAQPPLTRLALIRMADQTWQVVSSSHHLVLDGWSLPRMLSEVVLSYEGLIRGQEVPLEPVRPYRDYIAWLQKADPKPAESYWRRELAGFTAPTPLPDEGMAGRRDPTASPSGSERSPERQESSPREAGPYREHRRRLSAESTATIEKWGRRHQLTVNTLVQGAWALLLARYSGENDVVFGATVSGRSAPLPGIEATLGVFINTLPVRVRLERESPVVAWLRDLQARQAEMRQHEHAPLAAIQTWSDVPRGTPLFQTLVVFENYPVDGSLRRGSGALRISNIRRPLTRTNYPLVLLVEPGEQLTLQIGCDLDRYDDAFIARLLDHLATLLEGITSDPQPRLSDIPMLTPTERRQLIEQFAGSPPTGQNQPAHCLHQMFERQTVRTPDAVAVTFCGQHHTYDQLNRRANQLAHRLVRLGVGPDVLAGVFVERGPELLVAILGILKAGGAYVPLDPTHPGARLSSILDDARPLVFVTQQNLAQTLPECGSSVVVLDELSDSSDEDANTAPAAAVRPENLAYVIYTSGSTGRPKGVLVTHANVARLFESTQAQFGFCENDIWTLFHSCAFDFSVWEIWGALLYGGRLVVVPWDVCRSPAAFLDLLRTQRVTVLNQTPSAFRGLVEADQRSVNGEPLTLRWIIFGGEKLDLSWLGPWMERHGDAQPRLVNMYGITETTVHVTFRLLRREDVASGAGSLVGRPIADLQVYLLNPDLEPVPVGVPGELYVAGPGLARGYLNRPELTAQRFIPNPFSRQPGARLYKSGDLCRYRIDGDIEYLGRIDHQVQIRGYRVELGEVEAALSQHACVRECVVCACPDNAAGLRLVGYVVARDGMPCPAASSLRAFARERLPDYMVPASYVFVDDLPRLPSGKIDRRTLPAPDGIRPAPGANYAAPRNQTERMLADLWARALGVDRIGIHDNFFDLGGHSLIAARIHGELTARLQSDVPLVALFDAPTIAQLAELLDRRAAPGPARRSRLGASLVTLRPSASGHPLFCVHASGGGVAVYRGLADALSVDVSVIGIESRAIGDASREHDSIESMAQEYVQLVRDHQSDGPYWLLGWSMGATIALSMTRILEHQGEQVGWLGLLDPIASGATAEMLDDVWLASLWTLLGREAAGTGGFDRLDREMARGLRRSLDALGGRGSVERLTAWLREQGVGLPGISPDFVRQKLLLLERHAAMCSQHRPPAVRAPRTIWRAEQSPGQRGDGDGWRGGDEFGCVRQEKARGNHFTMMHEPYVSGLADQVSASLRAVGGGSGATPHRSQISSEQMAAE